MMAGLLLVLTLASLDQNIVATALPGIVSDLGGLAHLSWVVTAFLVASTATTPLYGKLSDSYGRRALFFVAVGIFLAGSALCGLAQGMGQLIAFRAVQGLGAGGLITLSQTTVGDLLAPRERGRYQGLFTAVFAACSVAGPLLGGFITDALSWRWIFYINLPIGAVALALIATTLRRPNRVVHHRIDFAGAALMVGGTVFAILVLTLDSSREGWRRPGTWVEAAASVACFALLVWRERRAVEPILPPRLFRDRVFVVGASVMGLTAVALFGAVIFLPLFFQLVLGAAASKAGLMLSPLMGGVIVASVVGGRLLSRTGRYKFLPVTGLSVACVAFLLLSWLAQSQGSVATLELSLVGLGLGLGLVMPNLTTAIQNAVAPQDLRGGDLGGVVLPLARRRAGGGALGRVDDLTPAPAPPCAGRVLPRGRRRRAEHQRHLGPARGRARGGDACLPAGHWLDVSARCSGGRPGAPDRARAARAAAPDRGPAPRRQAGRGRAGLRGHPGQLRGADAGPATGTAQFRRVRHVQSPVPEQK